MPAAAYLESAPASMIAKTWPAHAWIDYVDDLLFSQELLFLSTFCRTPTG
jgi:hypothetical protein